jgi:hypothetical protein
VCREELDVDARKLVMTPEMWRGDAIFFWATTLYMIVKDPVKKLLEKIGSNNVMFTKI